MTNNQITENPTAFALSATADGRRFSLRGRGALILLSSSARAVCPTWTGGLQQRVYPVHSTDLGLPEEGVNHPRRIQLGRLTDGTAWRSISHSGSTTDYPSTDITLESVQHHGSSIVTFVLCNTGSAMACEVWAFLCLRLSKNQILGVYSVEKVQHPLCQPHFYLQVSTLLAAVLTSFLCLTYKETHCSTYNHLIPLCRISAKVEYLSVKGCKCYLFKSWGDDPCPVTTVPMTSAPQKISSLIGWNSNGFNFKEYAAQSVASRTNAGVMIIGEHLPSLQNYHPAIPGYQTYSSPAKTGFCGLCILVQSEIGSYEKPTGVPHIIHLVVTNLVYGEVWNVFGVYLQSVSSHSKTHKSQLLPLWGVVNEILRKDPLAKIAIGGDFNLPPEALQNCP
ncbi:hypothetical protein PPACK8108_LOCUS8072 [Phakopsora pachyrhizi]|uniref:Endonuclease/exonuclease/phosphatase domain-containing protein n=1 Tax=Phakopsora pachyrhizi TaxID=170000 RepID=A0AAV0AW18_PHAPC|nr:hypothetical protein PPACK8108_LOCUS8072 [Phakopsora pachyrhizi]